HQGYLLFTTEVTYSSPTDDGTRYHGMMVSIIYYRPFDVKHSGSSKLIITIVIKSFPSSSRTPAPLLMSAMVTKRVVVARSLLSERLRRPDLALQHRRGYLRRVPRVLAI